MDAACVDAHPPTAACQPAPLQLRDLPPCRPLYSTTGRTPHHSLIRNSTLSGTMLQQSSAAAGGSTAALAALLACWRRRLRRLAPPLLLPCLLSPVLLLLLPSPLLPLLLRVASVALLPLHVPPSSERMTSACITGRSRIKRGKEAYVSAV